MAVVIACSFSHISESSYLHENANDKTTSTETAMETK